VRWSGAVGGGVGEVAQQLAVTLRMPDPSSATGGAGGAVAPISIVASFGPCYALTVDVLSGSGTAVVVAPAQSAGCAAGSLVTGSRVTLKAAPADGWLFSGWSGLVAAGGGAAVLSLVMPAAAATQRASFAQCLALTLQVIGDGNAPVDPISSPGCPVGHYLPGAALTLTASPAAGWGLVGWTGAQTSTALVWSYTMGSAAAVQTAKFGQCVALTLQTSGVGVAQPDPLQSPGCPVGQYAAGAVLTLSGAGSAGWTLTGWTGTLSRPDDHSAWVYTMPSVAATQTAVFALCNELTLTAFGHSGSSVGASPPRSYACAAGRYVSGAIVSLTATTPNGGTFLRWSGDGASGTTSGLSYTMPAVAANVVGEFAACELVSHIVTGDGSVSVSSGWPHSCSRFWFPVGAPLAATATPGVGSIFAYWDGYYASSRNPLTFTMPNTATTLEAKFLPCLAVTVRAGAGGSVGAPSSSSGSSEDCPTGTFTQWASVSVTATPHTEFTFIGWSGAFSGTNPVLTFAMPSSAVTVTASFAECFVLTTSASGSGSISSLVPAQSPGCDAGLYIAGASINVEATAGGGATFVAWSGASTAGSTSATFVMPAGSASLTATFAACYALTLVQPSGGSISASPVKSYACAASSFVEGATVTLTAFPNSNFVLSGWSGETSSTTTLLIFSMPERAVSVTASFAECFPLTLQYAGSGTVDASIPNSPGCAAGRYVAGASITLTGTGLTTWTLRSWTGTQFRTDDPTPWAYSMPASAASQTAVFVRCYALTRSAVGSGTISWVSPPQSFACHPDSYVASASITATATASGSATFVQWNGASTDATATTVFQMPAIAVTLTATFAVCYVLTLSQPGSGGSIAGPSPAKSYACAAGSFVEGASVMLIASPNSHFVLSAWSGAASGTTNPLYLPMPASAAVVGASFAECFLLTLQANDNGSGAVAAAGNNSPGCASGRYLAGASVPLTATPAVDHELKAWSGGGLTGSVTSVTLSMPAAATNVLATFGLLYDAAEWVLGQPDFVSGVMNNPAAAPGAGLSDPNAVAFHPLSNDLYVAEASGNRVLVLPAGSTGPIAVLGQLDFVSTQANRGGGSPNSRTLSRPAALAFYSNGGLLVADSNNNRVLYYPPGAGTNAEATRVYGQGVSYSTTFYLSRSATSLYKPGGLAISADGVWIADSGNNRVLFYTGDSTTAAAIYGQPSPTGSTADVGPNRLNFPRGIAVDAGGALWVADMNNHRVVYFPAAHTVAGGVIGQPDVNSMGENMGGGLTPSVISLRNPVDVALRADGLYVADRGNNRVLRYGQDAGGVGGIRPMAEQVWGQQGSFSTASTGPISRRSLYVPTGLTFDTQGKLYVPSGNHRVTRYAAP